MENITGAITLSAKEQRQIDVLTRLAAGALDRAQAAHLLGCSDRTVRRLQQRLQERGVAGLAHGNRGRAPAHKTSGQTARRVAALAGEGGAYHGLNACHLHELPAEREGVQIGRSTLDRLLKERGLRQPRRGRRRRTFRRRERMAAAGMLVQMDASPHDWLEGRGPRLTLLGSVDDATGAVLYLRFHPAEDQAGYLLLLRALTLEHGLPAALYHDRHTLLRSPKEATLDEQLAGREPMSQVQRVLHELGVQSIAARTPQAKGRVERLWGTLQGRPVAELRLAGVCAWRACPRWRQPTPSCRASWRASTPASPRSRPTRSRPGWRWTRRWTRPTTSRRGRRARCAPTRRSASAGGRC